MPTTMPAAAPTPALPRPTPSAPRPYHFPRIERRRLSNGMRLVVAPVRKLPIVSLRLVAEGGAAAEPAGREGLAHLTARLLLEGTARRDNIALTDELERLGATVEAAAGWDMAMVAMTVLSSRLREAFALFAEVAREPAFPEREVERLKQERLAELLQLRAEPRGLADEMFNRVVYDARSRYAKPEDGDEASVTALGRADAAAFYAARYRPAGMTLIVAGDVDADEAERLAAGAFGDWRAEGVSPPAVLDAPARAGRAVHVVAKADAPQSELRLGHPGPPRAHPDYFPVIVMNTVLGGVFSSRINLNLRERHGYTYGAFSGFDWRRGAGPFVVSTAVKSEVTADAAREALGEIDRVRAEPVPAEELSLATDYLAGVFPIRFETTAAIAQALSSLVVFGLPDDYFDTYRDRVRAVTAADVQRAARDHLHPDRLQLLAVGDPAAVRGPLEALGFGPLTLYDPEGRVQSP